MLIVFAVLGVLIGAVGMLFYRRAMDAKTHRSAQVEADRIMSKARSEAARIEKDSKARAKDFETKARKNVEGDIQKQKQKLKQDEQQIIDREGKLVKEFQQKEVELEQKLQEVVARDDRAKIAEKRLSDLEVEGQKQIEELKQKLERVAGITTQEARRELVQALEGEARAEAGKRAILIEEEAKAEAQTRAKRIIAMAAARYAAEFTSEKTVSVMTLPSDEMKGKIIGREGRNIRALEAAAGVDLIVDETPEAVVISGFDPVRREVARRALEKLIEDGRVHPARIEEITEKVRKELFKSMREEGEKVCFELGLHGLHTELVRLVGSMKYRQTQTQNLLLHASEVAYLSGMMAAELGVDVKKARRAGLLHDLGKVLDHSHEGPHAVIGADFAKKHGEAEDICHAIRSHHDDEKPETMLAFIVQVANALSNSRPGAKRPSMDNFFRRLEDMESIGNSFDGVVRTFALQTGRELRVIVEGSRVTEEQSQMLSYDIARKIERELSYPGQIRVNVVRETRFVEHAR